MQQLDGSYKLFLISYNINEKEKQEFLEGKYIDFKDKISYTKINTNLLGQLFSRESISCVDIYYTYCTEGNHPGGMVNGGACPAQATSMRSWCSYSAGGPATGGDDSNPSGDEEDHHNNEQGGGTSPTNNDNNDEDEEPIITVPTIEVEDCTDGKTLNKKTGKCDCPTGKVENKDGKCIENPCKDGKIYNKDNQKCECPTGKVEDSNGKCVDKCETTKDDLKKVFPTATDSRLKEIADAINKYGKDFGIDSKEKLQHFLAQAGHESDNFKTFAEYTNYQVKRLSLTFKKHFNPYSNPTKDKKKQNPKDYEVSKGSKFAKAEKLYNFVYNDKNRGKKYKLGNTTTGDGYKYRGRGIFQLTGRANYKEFNDFYQKKYDKTKNLIDKPELIASDKEIAVISALWYYENKVNITIDSKTTVESVTELVNGEDNGIKDRKSKFKKAKTNIDCK